MCRTWDDIDIVMSLIGQWIARRGAFREVKGPNGCVYIQGVCMFVLHEMLFFLKTRFSLRGKSLTSL